MRVLNSQLTDSIEQVPSKESDRNLASQEAPRILMKPEGSYCIHNSPSPVRLLCRISLVHMLQSSFLKIHFNITFSSTLRPSNCFLSLRSPQQNHVHTSSISHTRHIPRQFHSSLFCHPSDMWLQTIKLLVM